MIIGLAEIAQIACKRNGLNDGTVAQRCNVPQTTWLCGSYHLSHLLVVGHARVSDKEHIHVVPVAGAGEGLE